MASVDELWLVDFGDPFPGEPAYHRPALVVGPPDHFGPTFPFVMVAPCTTTDRGLSLHHPLNPSVENGLDVVSFVQCEQLRSINRRRVVHRLGAVDASDAVRVHEIVQMLLGH